MAKRKQIGVIYDDGTLNFNGKLYGNSGKTGKSFLLTLVSPLKNGELETINHGNYMAMDMAEGLSHTLINNLNMLGRIVGLAFADKLKGDKND